MTDSNLLAQIEEYLSFRRGLGFDLGTAACHLRSFARYAEQIGHRGPITVDLATRWALRSRSGEPAQAARRLAVIRLFARHRALIDPATEIPPVDLLGRVPRRKAPHIYNDAEIRSLLQQAGRMRPRGGLCPKTYVAFFALLFATGLRLSTGVSSRPRRRRFGSGPPDDTGNQVPQVPMRSAASEHDTGAYPVCSRTRCDRAERSLELLLPHSACPEADAGHSAEGVWLHKAAPGMDRARSRPTTAYP